MDRSSHATDDGREPGQYDRPCQGRRRHRDAPATPGHGGRELAARAVPEPGREPTVLRRQPGRAGRPDCNRWPARLHRRRAGRTPGTRPPRTPSPRARRYPAPAGSGRPSPAGPGTAPARPPRRAPPPGCRPGRCGSPARSRRTPARRFGHSEHRVEKKATRRSPARPAAIRPPAVVTVNGGGLSPVPRPVTGRSALSLLAEQRGVLAQPPDNAENEHQVGQAQCADNDDRDAKR